MNWTRFVVGAVVLAGCGDSGGDSRGDTQIVTSVAQEPTFPPGDDSDAATSPTGSAGESGSGSASVSSTQEATSEPVATEPATT